MNADGSGLAVVPGSGPSRGPAWSPDGKRLVTSGAATDEATD